MKKLEGYGIGEIAHSGLHRYLDDKHQCMQTDIVKSNLLKVTCVQWWQVIFNVTSEAALQLSQSMRAVSVRFYPNRSC